MIRASSVKLFENCPTQINLGTLHVELAFFFKVLGKCIDKLGAPYLLIESGALKRGSINGFIKGKSYNRRKIIHWLLSVSMQVLHFKGFLNRQCDHLLNLTL